MPPRRIAYIDHTAVLSGGEVAMHNLIAALDRECWEPSAILGSHGPLVERLEAAAVPVYILPLPPVLSRVRQGELNPASLLNPLRSASGFAYAVRLARRLRRQEVQLIHANSLRACVLAGIAGRLVGIPTVWQIHSVVGSALMSRTGLRMLQRMARSLPSHIICNSRTTAADFDVPSDRLTVVPCGVDSTRFVPNGMVLHERPRIGMIARFAPIKGQHLLVEAARQVAKRHPEAEFVMAGTPLFGEEVYAQEVQEHAQRTLRRKVQFLGFVDDVPSLLRELDVIVNPSTVPEGFGQAIVEAMMAGKPVIASALGGPVDVIEDGVTGRLVPAGDSDALANAINQLLSDPAAAAEMGRRGRERAVERYDIRETTRAIERVYERVLSKP
jgi:glycosyltransferase involved in cell wall biosynthesis